MKLKQILTHLPMQKKQSYQVLKQVQLLTKLMQKLKLHMKTTQIPMHLQTLTILS